MFTLNGIVHSFH